jgi:putative ATP-binding cassette transporter
VSSYTELAEWRAVVERLAGFGRAIERAHAEAAVEGIRRTEKDGAALALKDVDLLLPGGRPLMQGVDLTFRRGDNALISGPTGSGKSTLFRAIAGIWPFGRGEISMPAHGRVLFLPQKPYLPIGTLREVVSYPNLPGAVDDAVLRETLEAVGLAEMAGRLDESAHWALRLSPGEQQRIAFARALVQKPDWLFLDEATSAVDEVGEARLYTLLRDRLPNTTLLSVGHRSSLRSFHTRQLVLTPNGLEPATLAEVAQNG